MNNFLENNVVLFLIATVIAVAAWMICAKIHNVRLRRAIRASIVFLAFPVFYFGHPILYYQSWMLLAIYFAQFSIIPLLIYFVIWSVFIGLSQIRARSDIAN